MADKETQPSTLTVLDPRGRVSGPARAPASRREIVRLPAGMASTRFGLLGNGKPNVASLMSRVGERLRDRGSGAGPTFTKGGPLGPAPAGMLEALAKESDMVLIGVSDGGTATSWGVQDAIGCIDLGVPVALICTAVFVPLARSIMPPGLHGLTLIEIPHPFSSIGDTEVDRLGSMVVAELEDLLGTDQSRSEFDDGVPGRSDGDERAGNGSDLPLLTLAIAQGLAPSDVLYEHGLTDGLPVGLPTPDRVRRALSSWSGHDGLRAVPVPPRRGAASAVSLATNAVLAGLPDRLLPYLAAATEAACSPEFNLFGLQTTTNPATPAVIVGGPGRLSSGFNQGLGAMGPGNMANATLGRALRLCMQNLGGARASDGSDPATTGQPGKYTFCFAADEDDWPWPPLRMQTLRAGPSLGDDDAVTLVAVTGSVNMIIKSQSGAELLRMIADSIRIAGSNDYMFGGHPLLVLCPEHAAILREDGFTLDDMQRDLFERSKIPFAEFLPKNREMMRAPRAHEFARLDESTLIPIVAKPADLLVCVAGGPSLHSTFLPSFGGSTPVSVGVARSGTGVEG